LFAQYFGHSLTAENFWFTSYDSFFWTLWTCFASYCDYL